MNAIELEALERTASERLVAAREISNAVWKGFAKGDGRVGELEVLALMVLGAYLARHHLAA